MTSSKVQTWITLAANVGVVVGLAVLIIEINQNTGMMRAQMAQARTDNLLERYREEMHSDVWADILAKRRAAATLVEWVDSLTPAEYERAWTFQLLQWHNLSSQFTQYHSGYLDEAIWEGSARAEARRFLRTWPFFNFDYAATNPAFLEFLDSVAEESDLPTLAEGVRLGLGRGPRTTKIQ